ncbi:VirB4 family type IV secretion/conjugal transfer ATPase [Oligella ureolytica]
MINELYLRYFDPSGPADPLLGVVASLEKADHRRLAAWQSETIDDLQAAVRAVLAGLHRYDAECLRIVDRHGYAFSESAEFLSLFLISGTWQQVPITRGYLHDSIVFARPIFSRYGAVGELRHFDDVRRFGMLEITDYPEEVRPGHLDALMSSPYEFVLTQSWGSFTSANAKGLVKRHAKLLA